MIAIRLERFGFEHDATWGRMILTGKQGGYVTVEPPWIYNRPGVSCIPPGVYDLMPHHSERFPTSWALVGRGVSHSSSQVATRSAILIHPANWPHELQGCIAPGEAITHLEGSLAVTNSKVCVAEIDAHLRDFSGPMIEIVEARG